MRTIELSEAQNQLAALIEEIGQPGQEGVEITSEGERLAVLLPPAEYERFEHAVEQIFQLARESLDRVQDVSPDEDLGELERDLNEAIEKIRQERYEQQRATSSGGG